MEKMAVVDFPNTANLYEPPDNNSEQVNSRNTKLFKRQQEDPQIKEIYDRLRCHDSQRKSANLSL